MNRIRKFMDLVDRITFQTELLALNARIDAPRAGEAARRIAAVATEMRALAHRSSEAAAEIKTDDRPQQRGRCPKVSLNAGRTAVAPHAVIRAQTGISKQTSENSTAATEFDDHRSEWNCKRASSPDLAVWLPRSHGPTFDPISWAPPLPRPTGARSNTSHCIRSSRSVSAP